MENEKRKAYSEVVEILKLIEDEEMIEKIPFEVIQLIKNNSDPTYKPLISREIPLEEQNLKKETYAIFGWIAEKYWNQKIYDEKSDEEINKNLEMKEFEESTEKIENDKVKEILAEYNANINEIKDDYSNSDKNSFARNAAVYNDIDPDSMEINESLPVLISDAKWYQRIKEKIVKLFKILFRINKESNQEGVKE